MASRFATIEKSKGKSKREVKSSLKAETTSPVRLTGKGKYTICVASYPSKPTAEEEANRWNEAGYHGFVNQVSVKNGIVFRVCLGRYTTRNEARKDAEKLKEGFESGYWIDVMK